MKKAVTPLISSVLLIIFAVGLGALVMSWGRTTQDLEDVPGTCETASINIIVLNDKEDVCSADDKIYATVENNGETMLTGFMASIIGDETISQVELNEHMGIAEILKIEIPYKSSKVGNIQQLRLVPRISHNGMNKLCAKKVLELNDIGIC